MTPFAPLIVFRSVASQHERAAVADKFEQLLHLRVTDTFLPGQNDFLVTANLVHVLVKQDVEFARLDLPDGQSL